MTGLGISVGKNVTSGRSYPMGASLAKHGKGCNFALFSAHATKVELCVFSTDGKTELQRIELPEFTDDVWHGFVEGITEGCLYGYRVYGPFEPHNGHRFNPNKLLLDPYAKKIFGQFIQSELNFSYDLKSTQKDLTLDNRDNATTMPKCVVVLPLLISETHPQVRRRDTILYELHVKGFTQQNPDVPIELRGTFAGLANKKVCQYLKSLGVTSIELLPVQQFINEDFVQDKGLSNYWGYNTISFFVPHAAYCHSGEVGEFRSMVETYHEAGIEVILDVVYNHTAEGDELGQTLSFKGIDNASYYRLHTSDKRYYENFSGCGNTINVQHPRVIQLITDSLRYWVEIMGVDGFRFDLAPVLGRDAPDFKANNHFFTSIRQDPVLSKVKLIAEPWDVGHGGYQLGRFPNSWLELNDRFRDSCRRFWRGEQGLVAEFAKRLHGSSDIFEQPSRRPSASVNFITSHDGFTLTDLVSFNNKQNKANGEENNDGHDSNFSNNLGAEGTTDNERINVLRRQQKRNLLTTLFIAQGTPMLLSGDELNNSQHGNNNAYCQDNEISWIDWQDPQAQQESNFVKALIALRKAHPLLNRTHYQHGFKVSKHTGLADISWLNCHGTAMTKDNWHDASVKCFAMMLANTEQPETDAEQQDDALLVIFNAHQRSINYLLPELNGYWQVLINTATENANDSAQNDTNLTKSNRHSAINIAQHSCVVLRYLHSPRDQQPTYEQ
ncbi:glycogen debranching protein GlgX [Colwellia sp. Bg11-12]|uniref:glycogen debranching protein GlgX n=1 Tax=Colwellia sp. Bg11-12 TaxID=2759817 RepID=UPI0015F5F331|nr:glycogen debranching protein GlgX [Colwellia sp. Bg11-12]MBA6264612.1 glycogen debranching protein GlgX [Colwellia sp. Bg11-12]